MTKAELLSKLQKEPRKYVLCGSRYFNTANEHSDHDFFAQNNPEIRKEVKELGFETYVSEYTLDKECVELFRHPEGIDIILQKDLDLSRAARNIISAEIPEFGQVEEQLRGYIWRAVKAAVRRGKTL